MLSIIFSAGPVVIYVFGFLMAVGIFLESFVIWRRLRDLGIKEERVLDFIIMAIIIGLIFARLFFILTNFDKFGFIFTRWVFFLRYPGLSFWGWFLGTLISLKWFAKKEKWDFWQIADEVTFGFLPFLALMQLGSFLDGSGFGRSTYMPWGIYFPGTLLKRHPVSLFFAIGLFIIWFLLIKVERHWRTWHWYKSDKDGFIALAGLSLTLLIYIPLAFIGDSGLYLYWLEVLLTTALFLVVSISFYFRSGRTLRKRIIALKTNNGKENGGEN